MSGFRLLLAVHTPIVLPRVPPRLDMLVHEGLCRLHGDWSRTHDLPLTEDDTAGIRASQLVFVQTVSTPLATTPLAMPDATGNLDRANVSNPPRPFKETGGPRPKRLTERAAIQTPYAAFYGEGDGQRCAELLSLLDGLGREHMRGSGSFEVIDVQADDTDRWRLCAHRRDVVDVTTLPFDPIADERALTPHGQPEPVWRPEQIITETLR
jgi:hypothetical protein